MTPILADEVLGPSIISLALIILIASVLIAGLRRRSDRVPWRQVRKLERDYLPSRH